MAAYTINLPDLARAGRDYSIARKVDGLSELSEESQKLVTDELASICGGLPLSLRYTQCIVKAAYVRANPTLMIMIGFFTLGHTSGVNIRLYNRGGAWEADMFIHGNENVLKSAGVEALRAKLVELAG
jgi:hypothetical protein